MRGVGRVILGCCTVSMRREKDTIRLTPVGQADLKIAMRDVGALSDLCSIAQHLSLMSKTIKYMSKYLQDFSTSGHVFGEFRASKH